MRHLSLIQFFYIFLFLNQPLIEAKTTLKNGDIFVINDSIIISPEENQNNFPPGPSNGFKRVKAFSKIEILNLRFPEDNPSYSPYYYCRITDSKENLICVGWLDSGVLIGKEIFHQNTQKKENRIDSKMEKKQAIQGVSRITNLEGGDTPNLDDPTTLDKIWDGAINFINLQERSNKGEYLYYAPGEQKPYTGWSKNIYHGKKDLRQWKNGKPEGVEIWWYKNGQKQIQMNIKDWKSYGLMSSWYKNGEKKGERYWKDGKVISGKVWKPNGEKCPVTNVANGNGISVLYNDYGQEIRRDTIKNGEFVD